MSAQNVVPNANFSDSDYCPTGASDFSVSLWDDIAPTTTDYFNPCATSNFVLIPDNFIGFQESEFGDAYIGLIVYQEGDVWREYAQAAFDTPLQAGCYEIKVYYSNAELASISDGLGVHISTGIPDSYIGITAHAEVVGAQDDTDEWFELSASYETTGGETHITIGNFRNLEDIDYIDKNVFYGNVSYVFIDSVALEYVTVEGGVEINLGEDLVLCPDDYPFTLDSGIPNGSFVWNTGETTSTIVIDGPGTYSVEIVDACNTGDDEIVITNYDIPILSIDEEFTICEGQSTNIDLDGDLGSYIWSDGTIGPSNSFSESGIYSVSLTHDCSTIEEIFEVFVVPSVDIPSIDDLVVCVSESPAIVDLTALISPFTSFAWSDGSDGAGLVTTQSGEYSVTVSNTCFSDVETFEVNIQPELPVIITLPTSTVCEGEDLAILVPDIDADYLWQDGSTDPFYLANGPGIYQLTMSNECGVNSYEFELTEPPIETIDIGGEINICPGDSVLLSGDLNAVYQWSTGEVASSIWVNSGGTYIASFTGACSTVSDTVVVIENGSAPNLTLPDSIVLCQGDSIFVQATEESGGVSFEWNTGETASGILLSDGGIYSVQASNSCGVELDSILVVLGDPRPDIDLTDESSICPEDSILYFVPPSDASIEWSDGSSADSLAIYSPGIYWLELTNDCGSTRDSFIVNELSLPSKPNLGEDVSVCLGDSILLSSSVVNDVNVWEGGTEGINLVVSEAGFYVLQGSNSCGTLSDTILVMDGGQAPNVNLGADQQLCIGDSLVLEAIGTFNEINWNVGANTTQLLIQDEGIYIATVTNQCGTSQDSVQVVLTDETVSVSLGEDQTLCPGDSVLLVPNNSSGTILWSTGDMEEQLWVSESGWYGVNVTSSCGSSSDSILIIALEATPEVDLGQDTSICFNDNWEYILDLPFDFDGDILWSDGSTIPSVSYFFAGTIWVQITNACGVETDTIQVDYLPDVVSWSLPSDTLLCDANSIIIAPDLLDDELTYQWNTNETEQQIEITESGTYSLEISNDCGSTIDEIQVTLDVSPSVFTFPATDSICEGQRVVLEQDQGPTFDYLWQDGSTETAFEVSSEGLYTLEISNDCGVEFSSSAITVIPSIDFLLDTEVDFVECEGEEITIDLGEQIGSDILWSDGSMAWENTFVTSGLYDALIFNGCQDTLIAFSLLFEDCTVPPVSTDIYVPNTFTPNEDGINDFFTIFHPEDRQIIESRISIYNRWGELIFYSEDPEFRWFGYFKDRPVQAGVVAFYYEVEFEDNGEVISYQEAGDITITK